MSTSKFGGEKFDGKNDFNLWREKITVYLGYLVLDEALKGEAIMFEKIEEKGKAEMLKKARNTIILSLGD